MAKTVFSPLRGLNTESNYLSGRSADSLLDCANAILRRDGVLQSRKGHPVLYSSGTYGSTWSSPSDIRSWEGLVEAPNGNLIIPWQEDSLSSSGIIVFDGTSVSTWESDKETTDGGATFVSATTSPQYQWPSFAERVYTVSRSLHSGQDNHIITCASGLVVSTDTDYDAYVWSVLPVINTFKNVSSVSGSIEQRWWNTGNRVNFRAVVEYIRADGVRTRSRPSHVEEYINLSGHGYARIGNIEVDTLNIVNYDKALLKIYRTVQYDPLTPAPADYYLCYETTLSQGSAGTATVSFSNVDLLLNDDAIITQELIYTGFGSESGVSTEEVNRTSTVPAARDAVVFKGYTFYGNVYRAPFARLTMLTYPTFGTPSITVGSTSVNLSDFSNSVVGDMPSDGVYSSQELTFEGLDTTARGLRIDSIDGDTAGESGTLVYSEVSDPTLTSSGNATNLRVFPEGKFNPDRFPSPGIACLTSSGSVVHLFTYRSLEYSSTGGYAEFTGITSQGVATPPTLGAGNYFLWHLPGVSVENLPIYNKLDSTPSGVSLLPVYASYPTQQYMPFPIGRVSEMASASTAYVDLFGVYKRSEVKKIDDCMRTFARVYNENRAATDPVAHHIRGNEPGTVFFELNRVGPQDRVNFWDSFNGSYSGSGATFSPDISSSSNIVVENPHVRNGIVISKLGNPEEVSLQQTSAPIRVGDDDKKILRLAAVGDDLYIFKEEGIYRLNVVEGPKNPVVSSVVPVDLTTKMLGSESLQIVDDKIFFLADRGVCVLQGGYVRVIDSAIQSEIREIVAQVRTTTRLGSASQDNRLSLIRGFGSDTQKLYGLSFPRVGPGGTNLVYLYNTGTGQWTKSDHQFSRVLTRRDGRLTTIEQVYRYTTSPTTTAAINSASLSFGNKIWTILREDVLSSGFEDDADQYDEKIELTGASITSPTSTSLTLTRTTASPTTVQYNLEELIYRVKNRDLWYYFAADDVYKKATISGVASNLTLEFSEDISSLTTNASNDILYVGVTLELKFNRFYPSASYTNIDFEQAAFFDIGEYSGVTLSFGNGLASDFSQASETDVVSGVWRAYIPTDASSGTHLISRIQHSHPLETFRIAGHAVSYADTDSEDSSRNNC